MLIALNTIALVEINAPETTDGVSAAGYYMGASMPAILGIIFLYIGYRIKRYLTRKRREALFHSFLSETPDGLHE